MLKFSVLTTPIRLLAVDIDGTLLNPEFQISAADLAALPAWLATRATG